MLWQPPWDQIWSLSSSILHEPVSVSASLGVGWVNVRRYSLWARGLWFLPHPGRVSRSCGTWVWRDPKGNEAQICRDPSVALGKDLTEAYTSEAQTDSDVVEGLNMRKRRLQSLCPSTMVRLRLGKEWMYTCQDAHCASPWARPPSHGLKLTDSQSPGEGKINTPFSQKRKLKLKTGMGVTPGH